MSCVDSDDGAQDAFRAGGVEILSPHFAALRDGNASTIPAQPEATQEPRHFEVRLAGAEPRPKAS